MGRGGRVARQLEAEGIGVLGAGAGADLPALRRPPLPGGCEGAGRPGQRAAAHRAGALPRAGGHVPAGGGALLGAGAAAGGRQHRPGHQRRHAGGGGRQPGPEGRAAQDLQPLRERDAGRAAPDHELGAHGHRGGCVRADLRVLPGQVRHDRGPEGRRVLHAHGHRQADRGGDRALPRPHLRPGLWLGRHVRAECALRGGAPPQPERGVERLRPGAGGGDGAAGQDEPGGARPGRRHPAGEHVLRGPARERGGRRAAGSSTS